MSNINDVFTLLFLLWIGTIYWFASHYAILSIHFPFEIVAFLGKIIGSCILLRFNLMRGYTSGLGNILFLHFGSIIALVIILLMIFVGTKHSAFCRPEILKAQAWWCLR